MNKPPQVFLVTLALLSLAVIIAVTLLILHPASPILRWSGPTPTLPQPSPVSNVPITTQLFFEPSTLSISTDSSARVSLQIDTGENTVTAAEIRLRFDPALLAIRQLEIGDFWPEPVTLQQEINHEEGTVVIALGSLTPRSGSGTLLQLELQGLAKLPGGTTRLLFAENTQVSDIGGQVSVLQGHQDLTIRIQ